MNKLNKINAAISALKTERPKRILKSLIDNGEIGSVKFFVLGVCSYISKDSEDYVSFHTILEILL